MNQFPIDPQIGWAVLTLLVIIAVVVASISRIEETLGV